MKIAIAGDTAGVGLAKEIAQYLQSRPELYISEVSTAESGDAEFYAELSDRVCSAVVKGDFDRAILVCGTGIGVCIAANKVPGIRAALTHDSYSAAKASTSNNAQVITMGARVVAAELAKTIVDAWLAAHFDTQGSSTENVEAINFVDDKYHGAA